jgi:hypothetical protein
MKVSFSETDLARPKDPIQALIYESNKTKEAMMLLTAPTKNTLRPIYQIASDIKNAWAKVGFGASPYLQAMTRMTKITDQFGFDTGESVVLYFLSNAGSFRGEQARSLKAELKAHLNAMVK